jgi:hypothetical protein
VSATVAFEIGAWVSAGAGLEGVEGAALEGIDAVVFVGGVTAAAIEAHRWP